MAKKAVILKGSARKGENTDLLSAEFARGARESGADVTEFYLAQMNIHGCIGCGSCRKSENYTCVFTGKDDFEKIIDAVLQADVLVIASPIYFYSLTSQTKAAMDRFFAKEREVKNKTAYFITACAAPGEKYIETAKAGFRGFISCFENVKEGGVIAGFGMSERGAVSGTAAMEQAYEAGKNC